MTLNCGQKIDYRSSYIMKLFMKLLKKKKKKKKKKTLYMENYFIHHNTLLVIPPYLIEFIKYITNRYIK